MKYFEAQLLTARLCTTVHTVKSKWKISQDFVAFSEYKIQLSILDFNFSQKPLLETWQHILPQPDHNQKRVLLSKSQHEIKSFCNFVLNMLEAGFKLSV